jgi:cysteinyl-tRNA synthetase
LPLELFNTLSGKNEPLFASDGHALRFYCCGPTVYDYGHIGNFRTFLHVDVLRRAARLNGLALHHVMNITDVDDKINAKAAAEGVPIAAITDRYLAAYHADMGALGALRPTFEPRATQTMEAIIAMIGQLVRVGAAYEAEGHVLFDTQAYADYGALSRRSLDDMIAGARVDVAPYKRHAADFVLWKPSKPGEPEWESPFGPGRPGWHIECSAMAEELLGVGFDIHGGGSDLVFPHHENEAAQTRAARGSELAQLWMHNGMIQFTGEKMAKSVGNIAPLHDVLAANGPLPVIMYLASGHYRQPLAFSEAALEQARANVNRIREAGRRLRVGDSPSELEPLRERFFDALARDFNTPEALAIVNDWIRQATAAPEQPAGDAHLREMLGVLGLEQLLATAAHPPAEVRQLAESRVQARSARDFAAADRLRDEIAAHGWEVRDAAGGFELLPL